MLSKVLKGDRARLAPAMAFGVAAAAVNELRRPASRHSTGDRSPGESSGGGEERSVLLARVRTLEDGMAAAKREAFDAGRERGEQDARAAVTPVIERMNASIVELVNMRPELRRRAEKDAVELSLQIARRVLHRELSVDSNALNALARVVFDRLTRAESWQLTVHPQFAEAIRGSLPAGSIGQVRIEADPSCPPGTFVARCAEGSAHGRMDASIDTQLAEIGRGLTDRLAKL